MIDSPKSCRTASNMTSEKKTSFGNSSPFQYAAPGEISGAAKAPVKSREGESAVAQSFPAVTRMGKEAAQKDTDEVTISGRGSTVLTMIRGAQEIHLPFLHQPLLQN